MTCSTLVSCVRSLHGNPCSLWTASSPTCKLQLAGRQASQYIFGSQYIVSYFLFVLAGRLHFFFPDSRLALDLNTDKTLKVRERERVETPGDCVRTVSWHRCFQLGHVCHPTEV